jgi:hypothetical protein
MQCFEPALLYVRDEINHTPLCDGLCYFLLPKFDLNGNKLQQFFSIRSHAACFKAFAQ